jgi:hypothetical protein
LRHATPQTLETITDLLIQLRGIDGIAEKRAGAFSRGSRAFLHFHDDPTGTYADVRLGNDFERFRVTTKREKQALVSRIRTELKQAQQPLPTRDPAKRMRMRP